MEFSFELTPEDYPKHRRLTAKFPWAAVIAVAIVLPSLLSLYLGGFRITLAVVAGLLFLLLVAAFRAAARLKRRSFVEDLCTPQIVRICDEHLEIDGIIEWRRIDWSYLEQVEQRDGWVVIRLFEGQPLTIPPRAFTDPQQQQQLADYVQTAMSAAEPRESSELAVWRELDDPPEAEVQYTIDNLYMRSLVELRFHDRVGWTRVLLLAVLTAVGCKVWPNFARQIAAAGAAVVLPMIGFRIMEMVLKRTALQRAQLQFELPMTLMLHQDGYQRRCRLFQSFTSWLLVARMQIGRPFVLISHTDHEHLLVPMDAWSDGQEAAFCELGNQLRQQRLADDDHMENRKAGEQSEDADAEGGDAAKQQDEEPDDEQD